MGTRIRLEGVTVRRKERCLVTGVNWEIGEGEHWALIGANGSGKTTLLQVILGYIWPTVGRVFVLGSRLGEADVRELRRRIGFVSTNMQVRLEADQTAFEIVASGLFGAYGIYERLEENAAARARELLSRAELADRAMQPFDTLSQGEKQKVLIARSLMPGPELLILDEPLGGLDLKARAQVLWFLEDLARSDRTLQIVYVTHYPDEIFPAITHAAILSGGRMLAQGRKREVLTRERLSDAYQVPVDVHWHDGSPIVTVHRDRGGE
jgi:iron complex transport system ATP-binding protein